MTQLFAILVGIVLIGLGYFVGKISGISFTIAIFRQLFEARILMLPKREYQLAVRAFIDATFKDFEKISAKESNQN